MARAVARGVAPRRRFISGVHRSRSASGFPGLCQVGLRGRRRVGARWRWRKAPPQGSFPRPRKPWKPQVSSDLRAFLAAASLRLGREKGVAGGKGGPHPSTSEPRQPTGYLHVEEDIYSSLGKPAVDKSFQSETRLSSLLFCPVAELLTAKKVSFLLKTKR